MEAQVRRALKDILAGAIFIVLGAAFASGALAYDIGSPLNMGPAFYPLILGIILTRKIKAKFGEDKAERVRWYAAMRALQLRPLRLPKPQVKRGQYPV